MLSTVSINGTDLAVSRLCYGTNMLGTVADQGRSNELLDAFVALGGNFIDTARSYGDWVPTAPKGASERAIGAWLKTRARDKIVIATKGAFFDLRAGDWAPRVNPKAIASDLTESLEHLQVAQIDLWWLHADDPSQPIPTIIDALVEHQRAGRIRYFGASNWTAARIREAQQYAKSIGHQGFAAVQPFWGLAVPNPEGAAAQGYGYYYDEQLRSLHAQGLTMIPYAGQSRGFFTKMRLGEGNLPQPLAQMYLNETNRQRAKAVESVAKKRGVSENEIVLAYLLSQPYQTIPIIGATRPEQLAQSAKAVDVVLSDDELRLLSGQ
jgi:aryl-alcohol dehydrogenase-like predicted oxidoreductase